MTNSVSCWIVVAVALLLTNAPTATIAQDIQNEQPMEFLFSISGQVVDAFEDHYVIRSDGGRSNIRL